MGSLDSFLSAHLLDNVNQIAENIRLVKSDLFMKIAPDGHMPEETVREVGGIWYRDLLGSLSINRRKSIHQLYTRQFFNQTSV